MEITINGKKITTGKVTRTARVVGVGSLNMLGSFLGDSATLVKDVAKIWK